MDAKVEAKKPPKSDPPGYCKSRPDRPRIGDWWYEGNTMCLYGEHGVTAFDMRVMGR